MFLLLFFYLLLLLLFYFFCVGVQNLIPVFEGRVPSLPRGHWNVSRGFVVVLLLFVGSVVCNSTIL